MSNTYTLTKPLKTKLENYYGEPLTCAKCGKPIREGQEVYSRKGSKTHYYHLTCWKTLFH